MKCRCGLFSNVARHAGVDLTKHDVRLPRSDLALPQASAVKHIGVHALQAGVRRRLPGVPFAARVTQINGERALHGDGLGGHGQSPDIFELSHNVHHPGAFVTLALAAR